MSTDAETAQDVRLCIVEDDAAVAESLVALLASWGFDCRVYASAEACLAAGAEAAADCLLVDVRLPGMDGLALVAALRELGVATPAIMVTGHGDVAMAVRALQNGAQDFIEKPFIDADLVARIRRLIASRAGAPPGPVDSAWLDSLTPREREVMREVVAGHPNKVIAHKLGVSPKTVEIHRARVMRKSGAENLSHLVRLALKAGIDPEGG